MTLEWRAANLSDPSLAGFEGRYYVGQVVRYDVPAGWQGFVHGRPIDGGPWADSSKPAGRSNGHGRPGSAVNPP